MIELTLISTPQEGYLQIIPHFSLIEKDGSSHSDLNHFLSCLIGAFPTLNSGDRFLVPRWVLLASTVKLLLFSS